jgi:hypothetical protein
MAGSFREILASFGVEWDDSALKRGNAEVNKGVEGLKKMGEAVIAAFAIDKVKDFVFGMTEQAEALERQANQFNISTESLQGWEYAAKMSGLQAEDVTNALTKMSRSVGGIGGAGGKQASAALSQLGVKATDLHGKAKPLDDLMGDIADGFKKISDPAKQARVASDLFGRSGAKLLPLLKDGSEGVEKYRNELVALGGMMDKDFLDKAHKVEQQTHRLNAAWEGVKIKILSAVLPYFERFLVVLIKGSVWIQNTIKSSSALQAIFVMLAVGGVLKLVSALGGLEKIFAVLLGEIAPLIGAFLLIEDFITFMRGGDSLTGRWLDSAFGAGSGEKVRKWIQGVWDEFTSFIDDIRSKPEKLRDDWNVFTTELGHDMDDLFGGTIGGWLKEIGRETLFVLNLMFGGWANFKEKMTLIWGAIELAGIKTWDALTLGFGLAAAKIHDAFSQLWNDLVDIFKKPLELAGQILAKIPGQGDKVKELQDMVAQLEGAKSANLDTTSGARAALTTAMAQDSASAAFINQQLDKGTLNEVNPIINISVPPGTSETMAKRVGKAAAEGTKQAIDTRAVSAATKPGGL